MASDFSPLIWVVTCPSPCTVSPTVFLICVDGLCELENSQQLVIKLWIIICPVFFLADDVVGITEAGSALQSVTDIVYDYSRGWCFEAKVEKSAVIYFLQDRKHFRQLGLRSRKSSQSRIILLSWNTF